MFLERYILVLPYNVEINLKETASGLRGGRIPKPVYVQVRLMAKALKSPTQLQNASQRCQNTICCRCGGISSQCLPEYGQSCMMLTLIRGSSNIYLTGPNPRDVSASKNTCICPLKADSKHQNSAMKTSEFLDLETF